MNDRIKRAFDSIHAEEELKTSTLEYIRHKTERPEKSRAVHYRRMAMAVICALLVIFAAGGYMSYFTETAVISVDVNPSVEIGINRFDRVISVNGINEDGKKLASSMNIKFMNYNDALEQMMDSGDMRQYLTQDQFVSITVVGDDSSKCEEMRKNIDSSVASEHENVHCYSADSEETEGAHETGMSYGKYRAFLILQELDPSVTAEDVRDLTMRQIQDMIARLSGGETDFKGNGGSSGGGNGDGSHGESGQGAGGTGSESTGDGQEGHGAGQGGNHGGGAGNGHGKE